MRNITVEYYPVSWLPFKRYITRQCPQSWSELTPGQLIAIACLIKTHISDIDFIHQMTGIRKRVLKKLSQYQVFKLAGLFESFNDIKPFHDFIIPRLKCRDMYLCAPQPKMKKLSFGQFMFIDTYFTDYQLTANPEILNKFIAAAYLPAGVEFSDKLIDENSKHAATIPYVTREAVIINYRLLREWLAKSYPLLFLTVEEETQKRRKKKPPQKPKASNGWISVYNNLVGDDIVNFEKYAKIPLHNVLQYLTTKTKEYYKNQR